MTKIRWRDGQDRYGNELSTITHDSGERFRLVHHTPAPRAKQHCTLYSRARRHLRVSSYVSHDPAQATWIRVGGYLVSWSSGIQTYTGRDDGPDLSADLADLVEPDFGEVLCRVSSALHSHPDLWIVKPVAEVP